MSGNNDSKDKKNFEEMTNEEKIKKYQNRIRNYCIDLREATDPSDKAQIIAIINETKLILATYLTSCRSYGEN